ncbi:MAG: protein kinase [Planctomycetaceae bacterium]|nr:protein kinase [Planctomycetaceae bacterium]
MADYRELKRLYRQAAQLSDAAREPFLAALAPDVRAALSEYLSDDAEADDDFLSPLQGNLKQHLQGGLSVGQSGVSSRAVNVSLESAVSVMTPSCGPDETFDRAVSAFPHEGSSDSFLKEILAPPDRAGELGRFGEYRVLGILGAGGMGVVLRAEDPQLRRTIAMKLMRPEVASQPRAKERFLREAQTAAAVEDRHIVVIHHVGEVNGIPFLVMPLMAGQSLASRLRRGTDLPLLEAIRIARETVEGLAAAHARGLTHRDLKPDNIWLEETREGTNVRILDFGLARGTDDEPLTQPGTVLGTPAYMAPEQAAGRVVDSRADLFSLGCILYEMTTGRRPFDGSNLLAILSALANHTPATPRTINPSIPPALSDLVMRLLEKSPEARPASADEVAQSLLVEELALASPHQATSDGSGGLSSSERLRRPATLVGTLVVAALVVATIMYLPADRAATSANGGPTPASPHEPTPPGPPQADPLRIVWINVRHFARVGIDDEVDKGIVGQQSFAASLGDQVTIEAKLSRPAYAYLLAFRPDGVVELCFPEDEAEAPPLSDRPRYPSKSRSLRYGLSDGTGLTVLAVIASNERLPPYREWSSRNKPVWTPAAGSAGTVWWDDGVLLEPLTAERVNHAISRGKGEEGPGESGAVVRVTDSLKKTGPMCVSGSIGFTVVAPSRKNQ